MFGVKLTKNPLKPRSVSLVPMFSSMHFIVSGLIFKSLIHFELIFVYGVRLSSFILLYVAFQFSAYLLKRLYFPHCIFLAQLLKISCLYVCGFISEL